MSSYKGNQLISGHQVLYSTTGNNTNGAMTQKASTDNFVNKNGDTLVGDLHIETDNNPTIWIKSDQIAGTIPSEQKDCRIVFVDANNTTLGYIQNTYATSGLREIRINCRNASASANTNLRFGYDENNNVFTFVPTPDASSNDNNIATTAFCDGNWTVKNLVIVNAVSVNGSGSLTYSLSSYLPNDGKVYEILLSAYAVTGSTSGNSVVAAVSTQLTGVIPICRTITRTSTGVDCAGCTVIPIGANRNITLSRGTSYNGSVTLTAYAYRRVR